MQVITEVEEMQAISRRLRDEGKSIGFVPTMGAFHDGHLSLMRESRRRDEVVVVSIFVNPTQFSPAEDFREYPRDLENDSIRASSLGVDLLLVPSAKAIYPEGYATYVEVDGLSDRLCGASRPGHFRGVSTVVAKLFHLVQPHRAYFGQKDAQQAIIIRRMILDLNWDIEMVVLPTIREADGLAMSSRNAYLGAQERQEATVLYHSLRWAEEEIRNGERNAECIREGIRDKIQSRATARLDYVALVDPNSLAEVEAIQGRILILLAVRFGRARLIDNCVVEA